MIYEVMETKEGITVSSGVTVKAEEVPDGSPEMRILGLVQTQSQTQIKTKTIIINQIQI